MNELAFILLSKVGTPVGGFGTLIITFLVVYWVYKKDHPGSTHYNINIDANHERLKALQTEEVQKEISDSRIATAAKGAFVMPDNRKDFSLDFSGKNLDGSNFAGRDLSYANFDYASLKKANLSYANLDHASFKGADLSEADLYSANMRETDFRGANMQYSNYCGCKIMGMILGELPEEDGDPNHPVVIRNMQGEVIARLGEEQGCTNFKKSCHFCIEERHVVRKKSISYKRKIAHNTLII